jgi:hypothetical protein
VTTDINEHFGQAGDMSRRIAQWFTIPPIGVSAAVGLALVASAQTIPAPFLITITLE